MDLESHDEFCSEQTRGTRCGAHGGAGHVKTEAQSGVRRPPAKECREPPAAAGGWERGADSPSVSPGTSPADASPWDLFPPEL